MTEVYDALAVAGKGLVGDRYAGASGKRGMTLIQAEHLPVIAALAGHDRVAAALLRRNIVVSGLPVIALKGRRFRIGEVLLEGTDSCDPCSRMEAALGPGGYQRDARARWTVRTHPGRRSFPHRRPLVPLAESPRDRSCDHLARAAKQSGIGQGHRVVGGCPGAGLEP